MGLIGRSMGLVLKDWGRLFGMYGHAASWVDICILYTAFT